MTNDYYVYLHRHPISQQDLYVGRGRGDRAYRINSHGNKENYSDRHPDHSKKLFELISQNYLPHEWIIFLDRNLSREQSKILEVFFIKEFKPIFNRRTGPEKLVSPQNVKKIKELKQQGWTYDQMGNQFNVSRSTIYRIITNSRGAY